MAAYDVCFYLPENPDVEIEPALGVKVTFGQVAIAAETGSQIEAYHVSDEGRVDTLSTDAAAGNGEVTVTVVTDTFSTLIVTNSASLLCGLALFSATPP